MHRSVRIPANSDHIEPNALTQTSAAASNAVRIVSILCLGGQAAQRDGIGHANDADIAIAAMQQL
jgi:hypothetical protein